MSRFEQVRFRFCDFDWERLLERLARLGYRGAIVGPHGSGKTSLCIELCRFLGARGIPAAPIFVNDRSPLTWSCCCRHLARLNPETILLIDGADLVDRAVWFVFLRMAIRRARGVVITTHEPGLLPTLYECRTSSRLLKRIADDLWPSDDGVLDTDILDSVFRENEGNLRSALFCLYDICARDPELLRARETIIQPLAQIGRS